MTKDDKALVFEVLNSINTSSLRKIMHNRTMSKRVKCGAYSILLKRKRGRK